MRDIEISCIYDNPYYPFEASSSGYIILGNDDMIIGFYNPIYRLSKEVCDERLNWAIDFYGD